MIKKQIVLCLMSVSLLLITSTNAQAFIDVYATSEVYTSAKVTTNENKIYQVKKGDTLWGISQNYKIEVEEIKKANGLSSNLLQVGQNLTLPQLKNMNALDQHRYVVQKGDNLWVIAERNKIHVSDLKRKNQLKTDILQIGQILVIPSASSKENLASRSSDTRRLLITDEPPDNRENTKISYTAEEYEWLAKLIEAEAEDQPYQGKVAVGSVVMNRIKDDWFPDTIKEVIFQKTKKVYQFSPVGNGRFNRVKPSDDSYQAATAALEGIDPTEGALYFFNPDISTDRWIRTRAVVKEIGQHSFAN